MPLLFRSHLLLHSGECVLHLLSWGANGNQFVSENFVYHRSHLALMFLGLLILPRFYQHVLTSSKHAERWSKATLSLEYVPKNLNEYLRSLFYFEVSPFSFMFTYSLILIFIVGLYFFWKRGEIKSK